MTTGYTPGRWVVGEDYEVLAGRNELLVATASHHRAEVATNARLIAAAPALYETLLGAYGYLMALPDAYRPDPAWFAPLRAAARRVDECHRRGGLRCRRWRLGASTS